MPPFLGIHLHLGREEGSQRAFLLATQGRVPSGRGAAGEGPGNLNVLFKGNKADLVLQGPRSGRL